MKITNKICSALLTSILMLSTGGAHASSTVQLEQLRSEYLKNPLGIDAATPRFSWQLRDTAQTRGQKQTAYHVLVASKPELLDQNKGDLWDSGKVASEESVNVTYAGSKLVSNQDCYWKVRVFDKDGQPSDWSAPARFSMGLLTPEAWTASWINNPGVKGAKKSPGLDVTAVVAQRVANDRLSVRALPSVVAGGVDPAYGTVKKLIVTYTADGKEHTKHVVDEQALEASGRDLKVIHAVYGNYEIPEGKAYRATDFPTPVDVAALPDTQHLWFRKGLTLEAPAKTAFLHVASVGYHELYVNGVKADDRLLAPALTRLDKRILYVTYDVADLLQEGENVVALWTGPGWSRYGFFKTSQLVRAQLDGIDTKGGSISLNTDSEWRTTASNSMNRGGTRYNDNGGELLDARKYVDDWNAIEFDDSAWAKANEVQFDVTLSPQMMEPTRIIKTIPAQSMSERNKAYRFDLGKNFTGWLDIKIRGQAAGDTIKIKAADGPENVQDFGQLNVYICNGAAEETFRNRFNYIAGRYITIEGLKEKPSLEDVTGLVLATDLERVGDFTSSNELLNKIYEIDLWTYVANTVEGFTMDCPHRERLGYGEVAFATAWGIAMPNYRSGAYLMKHVRDWSDVQEKNGWFHHTAPQINRHYGGPMWSSAGLSIAMAYYETYGDKRIFDLIYPAAVRWLAFLESNVKEGVLFNYSDHKGRFLGDWAAPKQRKEWSHTPEAQFFNNCVFAKNLADVARMARLMGKSDEAKVYEARLAELRLAIHKRFFNAETNLYLNGTQVQQAFALMTHVTPDALRSKVFEKIEHDMTREDAYLDMGSSGLPVLFKYMTEESGRSELLIDSLTRKTRPSYGYFIERGETAWPEYWNVDVASRIHTCFTAVASWMTKSLGGVRPDPENPGFKSFIIQPVPAGDLSFATVKTESLYGPIRSHWERDAAQFKLNVSIPPNSDATVYIPTSNASTILEGGVSIGEAPGVTPLGYEDGYAVLRVESGDYTFVAER